LIVLNTNDDSAYGYDQTQPEMIYVYQVHWFLYLATIYISAVQTLKWKTCDVFLVHATKIYVCTFPVEKTRAVVTGYPYSGL